MIKGRVAPRAPGAKVKLQRKTRAGWLTVERDRLTRTSRYRFDRTAHHSGTKQFRVVKVSARKRVVTRSDVRHVQMIRKAQRPAAVNRPAVVAPTPSNAGLTEREAAVLQLTNQVRARGTHCGSDWFGPAPALRADTALTKAARTHADDMVARDYFDHTGRDGSQPWDRAEDAGYDGNRIGENIAWGHSTAERVVDGWVDSEGHCRNLMNPAFDDIGVAAIGTSSPMWVQLFGA